jgi:hypothetical protein
MNDKWEYLRRFGPSPFDLECLGDAGWELVGIEPGDGRSGWYVFKRRRTEG